MIKAMNHFETMIAKDALKTPIFRTMTVSWTFSEKCPHILTTESIKSPDGKGFKFSFETD